MADELSRFITSSRPRASLTPEALELMGKEAATLLIDKGIPLNESIAKLAGAHSDVNAEQVKRIVEFANQSAYLALHDKSKTAGAESSYPQFELADANRVLGDLSDGARPTKVTQVDLDYSRLPETQKLSNAKLEQQLEMLFLGEKKAEVLDFTTDTVVNHMVTTKDNLKALKESLESSAEQLDALHKEASADIYNYTKSHLLEGGSMADIVAAARAAGLSSDDAVAALKPTLSELMINKVASPDQLKQQVLDFVKVAHRVVDVEHPLVQSLAAVANLNTEIEKIAVALSEVDASLTRVNKAIKEEFFAGQ